MNTNLEREYKVLLTMEQFEALNEQQNQWVVVRQINTDYDTKDLQIRKQKGSMRIRERAGSFLFTLKLHQGDGLMEYEKLLPCNDVSALEDSEIKELLKQFDIKEDIIAITSLITDRAIVETDVAEICFDHNFYNGHEDYEIEYEYKTAHQGLAEFQKLLDPIHVTYEKNCTSKSKRAIQSL